MSADTKAAFLFAQEAACMVYANQLTSSTAGSEAFVLGSYRAGTLLIPFLFALKCLIYAATSIITVNAFHSKSLAPPLDVGGPMMGIELILVWLK
jgi:hypothetical protein